MQHCPTISAISGIRHGFFGREGGVSDGLYASLNCGYGSGDDLAKVRENRQRVADALGSATPPLTCFQIHSAKVITANQPWQWNDSPEADALVTNQPNIPLGVLTADCLPVLFADRQQGVIGAAHAGWKGALGGVLEATIAAMQALGARDIVAAMGPSILQPSYEVGAEFYENFMLASANNAAFFKPSAVAEGKYLFDLPAYARSRLQAAGIRDISHLAHDTLLDEKQFFSYRRATLAAEKAYGRQISVIMVT